MIKNALALCFFVLLCMCAGCHNLGFVTIGFGKGDRKFEVGLGAKDPPEKISIIDCLKQFGFISEIVSEETKPIIGVNEFIDKLETGVLQEDNMLLITVDKKLDPG